MIETFNEIRNLPAVHASHSLLEDIPSPEGIQLPAWWIADEFPELAGDRLPAPLDYLLFRERIVFKVIRYTGATGSPEWVIGLKDYQKIEEISNTLISARDLFLAFYLSRWTVRKRRSRRSRFNRQLAIAIACYICYAIVALFFPLRGHSYFQIFVQVAAIASVVGISSFAHRAGNGDTYPGMTVRQPLSMMAARANKLRSLRPMHFISAWKSELLRLLRNFPAQLAAMCYGIPLVLLALLHLGACLAIYFALSGWKEVLVMPIPQVLAWLIMTSREMRAYAERHARISTRLALRQFEIMYNELRELQYQAREEGLLK